MESEFIIEGACLPKFSCREVIQSLTPIHHGEQRRSVNGELCYIGTQRHHKYKSTVMCADQNFPGIQQLWVGAKVRVHCVSELWERFVLEGGVACTLSREAVAGSINVVDNKGDAVEHAYDGVALSFPQGGEDTAVSVMVSYRPVLEMRIQSFDFKDAEWEKDASWRLSLEEI